MDTRPIGIKIAEIIEGVEPLEDNWDFDLTKPEDRTLLIMVLFAIVVVIGASVLCLSIFIVNLT